MGEWGNLEGEGRYEGAEQSIGDQYPPLKPGEMVELTKIGVENALKCLAGSGQEGQSQTRKALFKGELCLVEPGINGGVAVLMKIPKNGRIENGHWDDLGLLLERHFEETPEKRFRLALTSVVAEIQKPKKPREEDPDREESLAHQILVVLKENLGGDNLVAMVCHQDDFVIRIKEKKISFLNKPRTFFLDIHYILHGMARETRVYKNQSNAFRVHYFDVPFKEMGYLLYELGMGQNEMPEGKNTCKTVEFEAFYNPDDQEFKIFEIRIKV